MSDAPNAIHLTVFLLIFKVFSQLASGSGHLSISILQILDHPRFVAVSLLVNGVRVESIGW